MNYDFTTIEQLQSKVSAGYGAVIQYGNYVFETDVHWHGGFYARVYEFAENPDEAGGSECECALCAVYASENTFPDNGSALKWCFAQVE